MRKTKIICTIGPSSESPEMLEKLILSGMDVARINTSHSSKDEAKNRIELIRSISRKHKKNTAIMLDLRGPKIRVGDLDNNIILEDGANIVFTTCEEVEDIRKNYNDLQIIKVDYDYFLKDIKKDCRVFIDDGLMEIEVTDVNPAEETAKAKVIRGGVLKSRKGINLPGIRISADSVTEKDLDFLGFGIENEVDFIAQSFVRDAKDIKKIKKIIKEKNSNIMVIAKIEKEEAVEGIDSVLEESDGIMIARGDLGIELPEEDVPNIQKDIIRKSNLLGKPVITATQMLDSMMRNPRPTRAEVSDVANAIYDGSDAVMLSGETAAGSFPLSSLKMMVRIINKTEQALDYKEILSKKFTVKQHTITEAISFAACEISSVLSAKAIITATQSGSTAKQISKNRPESMIIGASPFECVVRQLMMSWGVIPVKTRLTDNIDDMISESIGVSRKSKLISEGDKVIVTGGILVNRAGSTNFINVKEVE